MFYFIIEATPKPDNEIATGTAGAYVNCWIDFKMQEGAEAVARYYIEDAGWMPGEVEEVQWVEKKEYREKPDSLAWFTEAEEDGACFVYNMWPIDAEEETGKEPKPSSV